MASPHLCGLTAYYLSLQPSKESEYGLASITPEQLKKDILKVASKDKLSDVGTNSPNLLAFNGAGKSNYSDIIEESS